MAKKTKLESLVSEMSEEEVRAALLGILCADRKLRDDFIAARAKPADDLKDPALLEMIRDKAESIADDISWNLSDEEEMWRKARAKYGRSYIEEGDEFAAAVEDEIDEARDYASKLAKKGHVRLALEFVRIADELMTEALSHSDYDLDVSGYDITDLWEGILSHANARGRAEALGILLDKAVESGDSDWRLDFFCRRAEPAVCGRLLQLIDAKIRKDRLTAEFRESLDLPYWVERRQRVMKVAGETAEATEEFIAKTFGDCAFGQALLLEKAEGRGDIPAAVAACKKLLAFSRLPDGKRGEFSAKLAQFQQKTGDAAGELATLREAVRQEAAGLRELRRLRELLPEAEWEQMLSGFVRAVISSPNAYPGTAGCACLLLDAGDRDRLWDVVRANSRKAVWLQFMEELVPAHADEYGDFLLSHIDPDEPEGYGWYRRPKEKAEEKYARWADAILQAAQLPGQKEKAMEKAREFASSMKNSWPFRKVWLAKGLPGVKPSKAKARESS